MSFEAMTWAVKKKLPSAQKLVLLMLANRCNADTGRCDPSHKRLADDCGMSVSSVKRAIAQLEESGALQVICRRDGDVNLPNQYQLNLDWVGSHRTEGWVHSEPRVGSHRPTKQEFKQEDKTSCDSPSEPRQRIPFTEIFDAYGKCLPELPQLRIIDESRKAMIRSRWNADERFQSVDFWFRFFKHVSESDFLMGRTDRPWTGCCFDWLLKPANFRKIVEGNYTNA